MILDSRLHAFRPDLADASLQKKMEAGEFDKFNKFNGAFVKATSLYVTAPSVWLHQKPESESMILTELLKGETVSCFERKNGWLWVQGADDGYVGYGREQAFSGDFPAKSLEVAYVKVAWALLYNAPDLKSPPGEGIGLNGLLWLAGKEENGFQALFPEGWIASEDIQREDGSQGDGLQGGRFFADIAADFLNTPYLWGGRSWQGIDCSGLVQMALKASGIRRVLRDSDLQEQTIRGEKIDFNGEKTDFRDGDLVFWPGHVGIWRKGGLFLHANAFHRRTVVEDFSQTLARFARQGLPAISKIIRPELS